MRIRVDRIPIRVAHIGIDDPRISGIAALKQGFAPLSSDYVEDLIQSIVVNPIIVPKKEDAFLFCP